MTPDPSTAAPAPMSEPKRYYLNRETREIEEHPEGYLVGADDFTAMQSRAEEAERERDNVQKLLKDFCAEWNEECEPDCDSWGHSDECRAIHLIEAKRALNARAEKAEARLAEVEGANVKMRAAIEMVLAHRHNDKDGNYCMWVGESTFMQCEEALKKKVESHE